MQTSVDLASLSLKRFVSVEESTAASKFKNRFGSIELYRNLPHRYQMAWMESFAERGFDHAYYELLHRALDSQFEHYYLVLKKSTGKVLVQPVFVVRQNILAGLPAFFRNAMERSVCRWLPDLFETKTLMIGCSAGEGGLAGKGKHLRWVARILNESLSEIARSLKASLVVMKDFPSRYRAPLKFYTNRGGFVRIPSFPASKIDLHFQDFDDYMAKTLSHKTRKNLRQKFRDASRIGTFEMEVLTDFTPVIDEIEPLYRQTLGRSRYQFEILNREFFLGLGKSLEGKGRFFVWRHEGRIVAFTICVLDGDVLKDCYIGMDYSIALDAHLYFVTLRDIFTWIIRNRVRQYYSGPLNYSPKLHLKLALAPLDLYVRHVNPLINSVLPWILPFLEPTRYDESLPKFPNYRELK